MYRPRDAEHTVLHQVIALHLEAFLEAVAAAGDGASLPQFVEREFREFLTCGVFEHGLARFRCEGCAREHLVPFSKSSPRAWSWAALMHRAFAIDVLACGHCGGRLRLIATLHDPAVIRKILAHRAFSHSGPSPGPLMCTVASRPVSEYGRLCHGDGGHEWGDRLLRSFMLTCMKRLAVSSRRVSLLVLGSHSHCRVMGQ